jgi:hypothetical protein
LERFPVASARIIAMHFNVSHSTVNDILSQELGLQKFSRRWMSHQPSDRQKTPRLGTSVEVVALLDQDLSCSSKELQPVTSHGSFTLLNPTRCLQAGVRK